MTTAARTRGGEIHDRRSDYEPVMQSPPRMSLRIVSSEQQEGTFSLIVEGPFVLSNVPLTTGMPLYDPEELAETRAILSDANTMGLLRQAQADLAAGKMLDDREVRGG